MKIEVLGTGCRNCDILYENAMSAASGFDTSHGLHVEKISDIHYFARKGVFVTPGLVIADQVVSVGKVLSVDEIKTKIRESLQS